MKTRNPYRSMKMTNFPIWRRCAAALAACLTLALAGCNTPPAFSVSETPVARVGTVESIQTRRCR